MNDLITWIQAHPTGVAMGSYWVFSAAISSLPMPDDNSSAFYRWFFAFSHTLAGSIARAMAMKGKSSTSGGNGNGWKTDN